jgi:hypothetical protein
MLYNVPKLLNNGTNWITYHERAMTAVGSHGLKWHLEGHVKKPQEVVTIDIGTANTSKIVSSVDGTTEVTEDQIEEAEKKLDEYEQHECAIKQALYRSISDCCLLEIKNLTTATEVWKNLCCLHEDKSEIVVIDRRAHL